MKIGTCPFFSSRFHIYIKRPNFYSKINDFFLLFSQTKKVRVLKESMHVCDLKDKKTKTIRSVWCRGTCRSQLHLQMTAVCAYVCVCVCFGLFMHAVLSKALGVIRVSRLAIRWILNSLCLSRLLKIQRQSVSPFVVDSVGFGIWYICVCLGSKYQLVKASFVWGDVFKGVIFLL